MPADVTPPAPDPVSASFLSSPLDITSDSRPEPPKVDLYAADDVPSLLKNLKEKEDEPEPEPEPADPDPVKGGEPDPDPDSGEPEPEPQPDLKETFKDEDFSPIHKPVEEPSPLVGGGDKEFLETQAPEEQELVETLRWAEKAGKTEGKASAYVDFLKKHQEYLKSGGEVDSYEHEEWLQENRPDLNPAEVRQWEKGLMKHQIQEEMRVSRQEQEQKLRELEVRPELEAQRARITDVLVKQLPKEVLDGLEKYGSDAEGQKKLLEELPVETEVSNAVYVETRDQVMAYLNVTRGVEPYDPENPVHSAAAAKVVEFGRMMEAREDKEALVQDGKQFAPREKFVSMSPEERESHWTFTPEHILGLFAEDMRLQVGQEIEDGRKKLLEAEERVFKKYGLDRPENPNPAPNVSQKPPAPGPTPPPVKTRPSPTPSGDTPPASDQGSGFFTSPIAVESTLKLPNRRAI